MLISIACINNHNVLGSSHSNKMLWRDKQDLKFFSLISREFPNIVTRSTLSSMPPLADREFLIATTQPKAKNEYTFDQLQAILEKPEKTYLNIGGLTLYQEFLELTDHFIVCGVNNNIRGDLVLPETILEEFASYQNLYRSPNYRITLFSRFGSPKLNLTHILKTWQN